VRQLAGNSSSNPNGIGCNVADLCARNWHVCASAAEVAADSSTDCTNAGPTAGQFFVTRQSSTGCNVCALGTDTDSNCNSSSCEANCLQTPAIANDLFGCGVGGDRELRRPQCERQPVRLSALDLAVRAAAVVCAVLVSKTYLTLRHEVSEARGKQHMAREHYEELRGQKEASGKRVADLRDEQTLAKIRDRFGLTAPAAEPSPAAPPEHH
jgi:hypothetical protein